MKRILALLFALLVLTGCSTDNAQENTITTFSTEEVVAEAATVSETESSSEEHTEESTEVPTAAETEAPTEPETTECKHEYTGNVTTAATCTTDGVKTYTCGNCGHSYTESIAAQHNYECTDTRPATCSNTGDKTYTCKNCGHSYKETLPKNEHKWSDWVVTKEPTTTSYGQKVRECELCHGAQYASIDPLPADDTEPVHQHSYTSKITKAATCTEDGVKTFTCSCGASYTEAIAKTGHSWSNWVVTKEPTTSTEGVETRSCSVCKATETRSVDKLPADDDDDTITDCEANGYSHSISSADQVGYTRGADYYRVRCYCGHGSRGATEEAALAAHNKHVETTDINCNHGLEWIKVAHDHIAPSGPFICTRCGKEVAHSPIYAPHCDIIGCYD